MAELRVPPGCTGLQMESGGRYNASRTGRLSVENPADVKAIVKASQASGEPIREAIHGGAVGGPSKTCPACEFVAYLWTTECPRCHGALPAPAQAAA